MKPLLTASLTLNGVILALAAYWGVFRPAPERPASAPPAVPAQAAPLAIVAAQPAASKAAPFNWTQVEADDYATFIANLRAIGCPEPTIRQIVQGEVADIYADKRLQLQKQSGHDPLPSEIRKLEQEQTAVMAGLMQNPTSGDNSGAAVQGSRASKPNLARIQYPLVFQNSAASPPGGKGQAAGRARTSLPPPTPAQQESINQISQNFVNEIGGLQQDPSDPQYLARWTKAQRNADERMRSVMGATYYMAYHNEIARKAQEAAQSK